MNRNFLELFEIIREKNPRSILLISFEDIEIIKYLKEIFSGEVEVLTKKDFVGSGIREIIRKTRLKRFDLVVISNLNTQVNRTKTSIELLALLSKSFSYLIFFDENEILKANKILLLLILIPKIFIGILLSLFVLIKTYFYFYIFYPLTIKKNIKATSPHKLILFLRTDLAGKLSAGGSVTHIKGFISGAKALGFETIYASDFPLINHSISIIIKPNKFLDFFDEIQLMDYHFKVIKKLKKCLKKFQIGVIYQRHSIFNASGVVLSNSLKIPLILEVNNSEVWAKKNWSRLVFEKLASKIEEFAFQNAHVIGVVSEVTKSQIKKLGADENKIIINPNGVDPEKFSPLVSGKQIKEELNLQNNFVIGFIGTFTKWHGVETLFDAAIEVISKNSQIKFLMIGDGNLKSQLELKTHQLGLEDKIIFTGIVPHEKVPEYLSACDVLVSPHLGFESGERFFGSPTKLFEYMAMGKPIIASDLEQIGEIIKHDVNGLKFNPGNSKQLAEMILYLYNNQDLGIRLGAKAREDVIKNYTWEHNARRVLEKVFEL